MTPDLCKEIGYTWNSLGQREKLVYPDNSEVNYEYTASGKIAQVLSETGTTNYSYDAMGRIMERILPDSTITKYKLNPLGRLTSLTHSRNNEILDQFKYTYDPVGNITQIDKHRAGMEADSGVFEYRYDPLGRLVEAVHGDATKRYRYDELGNRIGSWQNGLETTHSYNARNQLIKTQEGGAVKEYRYDGRGNLTDITENGQLKANYTFDATNMMVGAFTAGKGKAEYAYNGFKNRVKKLESLQTNDVTPDPCKEIRYILDMTLPYDNLLMTQGAQNQSFVWGNSLLSANGEEKFHYLQDHLGSPIRLLGTEQTDTALAYDEFGVPAIGIQQNPNNPFGFTGYQMDDVSGLYFAQARYYEPMLGRFGAEDTHWGSNNRIWGDNLRNRFIPDISAMRESSNLYAYVINNPLCRIDPSGYKIEKSCDATDEQIEEYERALKYLKHSDTFTELYKLLETAKDAKGNDVIFTITFNDKIDTNKSWHFYGESQEITWNPNAALRNGDIVISPAILLAHEMAHAKQHINNQAPGLPRNQGAAILDYENVIARELGETPARPNYPRDNAFHVEKSKAYEVSTSTDWGVLESTAKWYNPFSWGSESFVNKNT